MFVRTKFFKTKCFFKFFYNMFFKFDQVWSSLIKFDQVWSSLIKFDQDHIFLRPCFSKNMFVRAMFFKFDQVCQHVLSKFYKPLSQRTTTKLCLGLREQSSQSKKKLKCFFPCLRLLLKLVLFSKFEIFITFLINKISTLCLWHYFFTSTVQL